MCLFVHKENTARDFNWKWGGSKKKRRIEFLWCPTDTFREPAQLQTHAHTHTHTPPRTCTHVCSDPSRLSFLPLAIASLSLLLSSSTPHHFHQCCPFELQAEWVVVVFESIPSTTAVFYVWSKTISATSMRPTKWSVMVLRYLSPLPQLHIQCCDGACHHCPSPLITVAALHGGGGPVHDCVLFLSDIDT